MTSEAENQIVTKSVQNFCRDSISVCVSEMKKVKAGVRKVGTSVQQAATSVSDSVQIETDYVSRKKEMDFPHEEPVGSKSKLFIAYCKHENARSHFEKLITAERGL